jgi:hypothetical protein
MKLPGRTMEMVHCRSISNERVAERLLNIAIHISAESEGDVCLCDEVVCPFIAQFIGKEIH